MDYFPLDHYWIVTDDDLVFSSASMSYVDATDETYVAWCKSKKPTTIPTKVLLCDVIMRICETLKYQVEGRTKLEALAQSTATGLGDDGSLTATQYIAEINTKLAAIRAVVLQTTEE